MGETEDFEWDDDKDAVNRNDRGLPLLAAAVLFDGRPKVERISRKAAAESRFETMAEYRGVVLFCVWIWNGKRRRIISLRWPIGVNAVPFKKQHQRVKAAIESVDWAALGSLSDDMIARRWQGDKDASWPADPELAEFKLMDGAAPSKPPQAAE